MTLEELKDAGKSPVGPNIAKAAGSFGAKPTPRLSQPAPMLPPTWNPVQFDAAIAGTGGAFTAMSAEIASPLPAKLKAATARPDMSLLRTCLIPRTQARFAIRT